MATIILIIIYLAFISMGLPDSLLGVTIPVLQRDWGISPALGGLLSTVVVASSIISSFASGFVIKKFGTGRTTFFSCLMTAAALWGFSLAPSFGFLILMAIPLGLGGGSIDTALNNYIALHYKARHMNWLHSFWGVGATLGPVIMARFLFTGGAWQHGYGTIAIIQFSFALVLLLSLPLWNRRERAHETRVANASADIENSSGENPGFFALLSRPGVKAALLTMMTYVTVENGLGLWGSSYLVTHRGFTPDGAARWISFYWGGITAGRFLSGFLSLRYSNNQLIRRGIIVALTGIIVLFLPLGKILVGPALVLIGLGLSPVFPAMLHETPERFGRADSQYLIGYQMGVGYMGSAVIAPFLGVILTFTGMAMMPVFFLLIGLVLLYCSERVIKQTGGLGDKEKDIS